MSGAAIRSATACCMPQQWRYRQFVLGLRRPFYGSRWGIWHHCPPQQPVGCVLFVAVLMVAVAASSRLLRF